MSLFSKFFKVLFLTIGVSMASAVHANICNLEAFYAEGFNYPTPKVLVEKFFKGDGFDYKESYTELERENLEKDVNAIFNSIHARAEKSAKLVATMTAGSPGRGKTTVMRQL